MGVPLYIWSIFSEHFWVVASVKPLCSKNDCIIRDAKESPKLLQQQDPLLHNEELRVLWREIPIHYCVYYCTAIVMIYFSEKACKSFLQIWSHLLKKSLMENFIFCAVVAQWVDPFLLYFQIYIWWKHNVKCSIHPKLNFTNPLWMVLLIEETRIILVTYFSNLTGTIQTWNIQLR